MKSMIFLMIFFSGVLAYAENASCPAGFEETATHCIKPPSYGRGRGHSSMVRCELEYGAAKCEKCLSLYFPLCADSFEPKGCNVCQPVCPPNTTDVGLMCQK